MIYEYHFRKTDNEVLRKSGHKESLLLIRNQYQRAGISLHMIVRMVQDPGQIAFHPAVLHRKAQGAERFEQHGILTLEIITAVIQPVGAQRADDRIEDAVDVALHLTGMIGQGQELVHDKDVAAMVKADISAGNIVEKGVQRLLFVLFILRIGFDN